MSKKRWMGVVIAASIAICLVAAEGSSTVGQNAAAEPEKPVCLDCHRSPNIHTNEVATWRFLLEKG